MNANGNTITSFARELNPTGAGEYLSLSIYIYIYIYETSRQIHLSRKQYLYNRDKHQHSTSQGMDCYQWTICHMEVRPNRLNETQFFPSSGWKDIAVWIHYMDGN